VLALKLRRQRNYEGWLWVIFMALAFAMFSMTVGGSLAHRAATLGQVPLKPCKSCLGCACPKLLGGPRCACPQ
jgi:hypothetical protein